MKLTLHRPDNKTVSLFVIAVALNLLMGAFNPSKFFSLYNFQSMLRQMSELGIFALALFVIIVSGGLNLSVVSIANLSAICGGTIIQGLVLPNLFPDPNLRLVVGILVTLIVGILCGMVNGFFVAGLGLTAVLVTSATMQFFEGLSLLITQGQSIMGAPPLILALGADSLFGVIPYLFLLLIVCYVILSAFFNITSYGELCRLLGANAVANKYSGNSNFRTLMYSYMLSGFFSAVAGIVTYSRMGVLRSDYGSSFRSTALLVVIMGGAMVTGGGGKVINIFLALFSLQALSTGLTLAGVQPFARNVAWGLLLLCIIIGNTRQCRALFSRWFSFGRRKAPSPTA